jgi:hypothetical protein
MHTIFLVDVTQNCHHVGVVLVVQYVNRLQDHLRIGQHSYILHLYGSSRRNIQNFVDVFFGIVGANVGTTT